MNILEHIWILFSVLWFIPLCIGLFFLWLNYKITHNWKTITIEDFIDRINENFLDSIVWAPILNYIIPIKVIISLLLFYLGNKKI